MCGCRRSRIYAGGHAPGAIRSAPDARAICRGVSSPLLRDSSRHTRRHCEPVQFGGVLAFRPSPFAVLLMKEKRMLQAEKRIDRLLGTEHAKPLLSLAQLPFSLSRDVRSMNSSMIGCRPPVRRFSPAFAGTVIFGSGVAAAFTPSLLSMSPLRSKPKLRLDA